MNLGRAYTNLLLKILKKKKFWKKSGQEFVNQINNRSTSNEYLNEAYRDAYDIESYFIDDKFITYEIGPNKTSFCNFTIFYLYGGGFVNDLSPYQYSFIFKLVDKFNCKVIVPLYPHAPMYQAKDSYNFLLEVYQRYNPNNIVMMADSCGGTLALGLCEQLKEINYELPRKLILFSPLLDGSLSNPKIDELDDNDRYLSKGGLLTAVKWFAGYMDLNDYHISPINGDLKNLPRTVVYGGTNDILYPDMCLFIDKLKEENVNCDLFTFENACHDYQLYYGKEVKETMESLIRELS